MGVATVSAVVRDLDLDLELVERHRYGDDRAFNEVYARYMGDNRPARSTVQVAALPAGAQVEVEVIAECN